MARMKFLCDADRCIECNACVTACKNENEVPWGINRRRVVTLDDGQPGERSVSMACMHCTDAPCRRSAQSMPSTRRPMAWYCIPRTFALAADIASMRAHSARRNILGSAISARAARGQMHLLRRRPRAGRQRRGIREIRRQPPRRRQAAALRRDVCDQVPPRGRRGGHRRDLQGARHTARLRLRSVGLENGLSRDGQLITATKR